MGPLYPAPGPGAMSCLEPDVIADLLGGVLPEQDARAVQEHVDSCPSCLHLLHDLIQCDPVPIDPPAAQPSARLDDPDASSPHPRGTRLGRYVLQDLLGSGGMGTVYAAYDPDLDRRVALKVLRTAHIEGDEARLRLLREARAMARLSHPNIVTVHDVGLLGSQLFIAMELVDGWTLRHWLAQRPRRHRDVLAVFLQAGRGLSAAHAASVIHRDFKPENVLCCRDGRVLITDFGLARMHKEAGAEQREAGPAPAASSASPTLHTRSGMRLGTPAYMAPEQHLGQPVSAQADQFAFCVALYEALYGEHPFAAKTTKELARRVCANDPGRVREAPAGSRVPARLRRVLLRGLATAPADRHASMEALCAALAHDPRKVLRRAALHLGLPTAAALVALIALQAGWPQRLLCRRAAQRLAGIWDPPRQRAIEQAFGRTAVPYARDAFAGVAQVLDEYTRRWVAQRTEACEATQVRGEQSQELLDRRMVCLERRLGEAKALSDLYTQADAQVVESAVQAASRLPSLDACSAPRMLLERVPPPPDEATRVKVEEVRRHLADAAALEQAGRYQQGLPIARAASGAAEALRYAPIAAQAGLVLGSLQDRAGAPGAAEQILRQALGAALAGRDDEAAMRIGLRLSLLLSAMQPRVKEWQAFQPIVEALVERQGDEGAQAELLDQRGDVLRAQAQLERALGDLQLALKLTEKVHGAEHLRVATVLRHIATVHHEQGRYEEALALDRRVLAISEKALGPSHPQVAVALHDIGIMLRKQRRVDEALRFQQRALLIGEKALGSDHPMFGAFLSSMGAIRFSQGRYEEAAGLYQRALAIAEKAYGPEHPATADPLHNLGAVRAVQGRSDEALRCQQRALAIAEKTYGPEHPNVADSLDLIGTLLQDLDRPDEAARHHQRALAIREKVRGPGHPDVLDSLINTAESMRRLGQRDEALRLNQRALAGLTREGSAEPEALGACLIGIGLIRQDQGRQRQAMRLFQRGLRIQQEGLGATHPEVAKTLVYMAALLIRQGQYGSALAHYRRALSIVDRDSGTQKIRVKILGGIGKAYLGQGDSAAALPYLERALREPALGASATREAAELRFALARAQSAGQARRRQ